MKLSTGFARAAAAAALCALLAQCYALRPSSGGADVGEPAPRTFSAAEVALPAGYEIELVAHGLTFPTGIAFDGDGAAHVVEAGYCYGERWTTPRLLRVDGGALHEVARGERGGGPWTGVAWHDGAFFVADGNVREAGRILRIEPDGSMRAIVEGLPSVGDHHVNGPAVGSDGKLYFGIGTATNAGVVGEDNAKFGWLARHPGFHDVPGIDIELVGQNFESADPRDRDGRTVQSGAFVPFGTATTPGQRIEGRVPCTGAVLEVSPDGSGLALVAWGFRNPFGLTFAPDGTLYVTDNGYDERGSRPVWGCGDVLWAVQRGTWYGWPDFSGDRPLTDDEFDPPAGDAPKFLLAQHPNTPPAPRAVLPVHCSADGLDVSRSEQFGHVGHAFVALFGDQTPATGDLLAPVGFKVVRVDLTTGVVHEFAANHGDEVAPASARGGGGLERPIAVRFDPSGAELWVVDFGVLIEPGDGSKPVEGTGCIWRIRRTAAAAEGPR